MDPTKCCVSRSAFPFAWSLGARIRKVGVDYVSLLYIWLDASLRGLLIAMNPTHKARGRGGGKSAAFGGAAGWAAWEASAGVAAPYSGQTRRTVRAPAGHGASIRSWAADRSSQWTPASGGSSTICRS